MVLTEEELQAHVTRLITDVCLVCNVTREQFFGRCKPGPVVRAREWVLGELRDTVRQNHPSKPTSFLAARNDGEFQLTVGMHPLSFPRIGKLLNCHHTTVILALRRVKKRRAGLTTTGAAAPGDGDPKCSS